MVSVIMPCYNAGKYIREAIESVVNQTYQNWELIIVNDGSTDNSQQVVENYIQSLITNSDSNKSLIINHKSQIRLINQSNFGACRARNNGIEHANGEYIKFLDADDILLPDCLQQQVNQMQSLKPNQIPYGDYGNITEDGTLISQYIFSPSVIDKINADQVAYFVFDWHILISSPLHRKKHLDEINHFDENLHRHQESDLHLRLALNGVEFVHFPTSTFLYRDYISKDRISSNYGEKTKKRQVVNAIYTAKIERLLLEHYQQMPLKYNAMFASFWFGKARTYFSQSQVEQGKIALTKSKQYVQFKGFRRMYHQVGMIIGYINLERLFQLRLRLLHKQ